METALHEGCRYAMNMIARIVLLFAITAMSGAIWWLILSSIAASI